MGRYRKRPEIVIEAVQFFPPEIRDHEFYDGEGALNGVYADPSSPTGFSIGTLEGKHEVTPGDWIITGVKGEKYPCKPEIFAATYEAVES